jgi:hypothetical protein
MKDISEPISYAHAKPSQMDLVTHVMTTWVAGKVKVMH